MKSTDGQGSFNFNLPRAKHMKWRWRRADRETGVINPNGHPDDYSLELAYKAWKRRPKMVHPCKFDQSTGKCYLHPDHCPNLIAHPAACPRFEVKGQNMAQEKIV